MVEAGENKAADGGEGAVRRPVPSSVLLRIRSWFGPFARLFPKQHLGLGPVIVPLVGAADGVRIEQVSADPLSAAESGIQADGWLKARAEPATILPGKAGRLVLSGQAPVRAGRYSSAVRLLLGGRDKPVVLPVNIEVSASPLWGIGFMVLGLIALGVVNVLGAEGALRSKQRDVLQTAQAFHERIERSPVPQRRELDVTEIDREYAAALTRLAAPRSLGVIDHRGPDAEQHIARADRLQADLSKEFAGRPGESEIADMLVDWKRYQDVVHDLGQLAPPYEATLPRPPAAAGLAALVDAYQARYTQRFVRLPIEYNTNQLNDVILGIRLAAAGGRTEEARSRALAARRWLQRASDDLARGLAMAKNQKLLGFNTVSNAMQVQRRLDGSDLPADRVSAIQALLDAAAAALAASPPPVGNADDVAFAEATKRVSKASVELTRARSELVLDRVRAAIAKVQAETGVGDIEEVLARVQAVHPTNLEQKIAGLRRILDAWRTKIALVPDQTVRNDLASRVDVVSALLDKGDLRAVSPPYKELLDAWSAWGMRRVGETTAAVLGPYCEQDKQLDLVRIAQLTETLRQKEPRPELAQWEQELDRIRADTLRVDPKAMTDGPECRTMLQSIEERTLELGNAIFKQETLDAPIQISDQRAALEFVGLDTAVLSRPRGLTLDVQTSEAEREVGRRIRLSIVNRDPAWGAGVTVAVDFGDGSPMLRATAEALIRNQPIEHEYRRPLLAHLRAVAAEQDDPFADNAVRLGEGSLTVSIRPSAITAAEALSDTFLNARFALALLIAGVIYYWRFHAGKRVFGARSFDYVEAFALGFVVNAAVADLPDRIARIVTIG